MATELIKRLRQLALELYVRMEMDCIVNPARHENDALTRLCMYAKEHYERFNGLPVRIYIHRNGEVQIVDPVTDSTDPELLKRAVYLLESAVDYVWKHEYRCNTTLSTLEFSCEKCLVYSGLNREAEVYVSSCARRSVTRYGVGGWCVHDFAAEVHIYR
jgi:hypothetical protein